MVRNTRRPVHSQYLSIAFGGRDVSLTFVPPFAVALGQHSRRREACRRVKLVLRNNGVDSSIADGTLTARISNRPAREMRQLLKAIDAAVDAYGRDRLAGRHVEAILQIAPRERRKWTKDGRLPLAGTVSFKRGGRDIHLPVYSANKIASLAADPGTIAAWRRADDEAEVL